MQLIKQSLRLSWNNLILFVPFLIQSAIGVLAVFTAMAVLLVFGLLNADTLQNTEGNLPKLLFLSGGMALIYLLGYYLVHSFVLSGVFGMIKEVLEGKEGRLSHFFTYGKRYVWKAFSIQFVVYFIVIVLTIPMTLYFAKELTNPDLIEFIPIGLFISLILYLFISLVLMLIAQFSILSVIRDDFTIGKAIQASLRVMTKGVKDCFVLLGVFILLLVPLAVLFVLLNIIPVAGSLLFAVVQYFFMVVLLVWSVLFYDKYK